MIRKLALVSFILWGSFGLATEAGHLSPPSADSPEALSQSRKFLSQKLSEFYKNSPCWGKENPSRQRERQKIEADFKSFDWKKAAGQGLRPLDVMSALHGIDPGQLTSECVPSLETLGFSAEAWAEELCLVPAKRFAKNVLNETAAQALTVQRLAVLRSVHRSFEPVGIAAQKVLSCMETWKGLQKASMEIFHLAAKNYSRNYFTDYLEDRLLLGDSEVPALYEELARKPELIAKLPAWQQARVQKAYWSRFRRP